MLLSSHPEITHPGSPRVSYRPRNPPPKARKSSCPDRSGTAQPAATISSPSRSTSSRSQNSSRTRPMCRLVCWSWKMNSGHPPASFTHLMTCPPPSRASRTIRSSTASRFGKFAPASFNTCSYAACAESVVTAGVGNGSAAAMIARSKPTPRHLRQPAEHPNRGQVQQPNNHAADPAGTRKTPTHTP